MGIPNAVLMVEGISHNITSYQFGDYWRLLVPGTYSLTAVADGYQSETKIGLVVPSGEGIIANFTLSREGMLSSVEEGGNQSGETSTDSEIINSSTASQETTTMASVVPIGKLFIPFP